MSDAVADAGTNTEAAAAPPPEVPVETPSPASDPQPEEAPVVPELPAEPPQPVETPVIETPAEVPAEASQPPATSPAPTPTPAATSIAIKDRLYAALEKIRFNKRKKLDKIVELARQKGRIKNDDVEKLVRVSDATASRYLAQLVREGRLKRVGAQKQPSYETV